MAYPHSSRVSPYSTQAPALLEMYPSHNHGHDKTDNQTIAIRTPDLHPLELYSIHTSLSFLVLIRFSGRIAVVSSPLLVCPIASPCPHFFIFPWPIPVFAVQILDTRLFLYLLLSNTKDALLPNLLPCHLVLELGCSFPPCTQQA